MQNFEIVGGHKLFGETNVQSAKNAVLPVIAGTILCDETINILNVPNIVDVHKMCDILKKLGADVLKQNNTLCVNTANICSFEIDKGLMQDIRSSIFLLGPLLAKHKKAKVAFPGGCKIGARPIDLHLAGLKALGVKIEENVGSIECDGSNMKAGLVHLDFPSVGATENLMLASVFLKGTTTIVGCAKEPEIVDLAKFINKMGGKVRGAGTSVIKIVGVKKLHGVDFECIPDRICTGTLVLATAMAGGKVWLKNVVPEHIFALIVKLRNSGCQITFDCDNIYIQNSFRLPMISNVHTLPYPGFPTDLQSPLLSFMSVCDGVGVVEETMFENRFLHAYELCKMGAKIVAKNKIAVVEGVKTLVGADVVAKDLRCGAGLVIAGLSAVGKTRVFGVELVDRGYDAFENQLALLGADIVRKHC